MKPWDTVWADNRVWFFREVPFKESHWETHCDDMICFSTTERLQSYPDYTEFVVNGVVVNVSKYGTSRRNERDERYLDSK